jgi:glutamyl-tRNA reductase
MSLYTLGLNHTTAPLDLRERVTFAPDALSGALRELTSQRVVKEAAILSTCNRTEVYFHGGEPEPVARWLESAHRLPPAALRPYVYTLNNDRAVTHAFRVASGLDSMVLGEPQILGQMKQAVRQAEAAGSLGLVLNRLFQRTFAVAKDVRTQTDIGTASISMAAASVKIAERIFPSLSEQRLLANGASPADVVESLSRSLTNKFLHPSLAALNAAGDAERAELIALFSRIYGCAEPPES